MRITLFISGVILLSNLCFGATINVPADQPTIQAGIDAAASDDTVCVAPGIYTGNGNMDINFHGKAVMLMSEQGSGSAIIVCGYDPSSSIFRRAFVFQSGEGPSSVINGFTIQGATGFSRGGSILCFDSHPKIENCIFFDNEATFWGGAIYLDNNAAPQIVDCLFDNNRATGWAAYGGAIGGWSCSPYIENCIFKENNAGGYGGAIFFSHGTSPVLKDCLFESNVTTHGGGYGLFDVDGSLENCVFIRNAGSQKGGAVFLQDDCSPQFKNCTFYDNTGTIGGAFYIQERSSSQQTSPSFDNVIIAYNNGSPAFVISNGTPTFECTDIYGNVEDWTGYLASFLGIDGNITSDPLFCDTAAGDYHLDAFSPCAPANNDCGELIGALEIGCGAIYQDIVPDPMGALMAHTVDPMIGTACLRQDDMDPGVLLSDMNQSTIELNAIPNGDLTITLDGDVMSIEFDVADFINGYPLWWDTGEETYTISGQMNDATLFSYGYAIAYYGHRSGDANLDGSCNLGDASYIINFIFYDGDTPRVLDVADANCDGVVNLGDAGYMINYIFFSGATPCHVTR